MEYRYLGNTGLQVSAIGFGNMINFKPEDEEVNVAIVKRALELGVNFFDTAEAYQNGEAELALGRAFKKLDVQREKIVVSTKLAMNGASGGNPINRFGTLSRKHIIEGANASLKRLQLDYVDVLFAHAYDDATPVEEVVRGFNQVIEDGKALYWATSNWKAYQIQEAIDVSDRLKLHRPIAEQCQYNMIERKQVEVEYGALFDTYHYGTTIWSPLLGGVLSGKYNNAIPEQSRVNQGIEFLPKELVAHFYGRHTNDAETVQMLRTLGEIAKENAATQAQLAVAWTLRNKDVSIAICGARSVEQLEGAVEAVNVLKRFTPELDAKIESVLKNRPASAFNARTWAPHPSRR